MRKLASRRTDNKDPPAEDALPEAVFGGVYFQYVLEDREQPSPGLPDHDEFEMIFGLSTGEEILRRMDLEFVDENALEVALFLLPDSGIFQDLAKHSATRMALGFRP